MKLIKFLAISALSLIIAFFFQQERQRLVLQKELDHLALILQKDRAELKPRYKNKFPLLHSSSLLNGEDIRLELVTTDEQENDLDSLLRELERDERLITGKFFNKELNLSEYESMKRGYKEKLHGILLPHQLERLGELACRMQIRRRGFLQFLEKQELSELENSKIAGQLKKIKTIASEAAEICNSKFFSSLEEILEMEQVVSIKKSFPTAVPHGSVDAFMCQLEIASMDSEQNESGYLDLFVASPWFRLDSNGTWTAERTFHSNANAKLAVLQALISFQEIDWDISDSEREEIEHEVAAFFESRARETEVYSLERNSDREEAKRNLKAKIESRERRISEFYDQFLSGDRHVIVEQFVVGDLLAVRYGLPGCLVLNPLSDKFRIDEDQKEKLRLAFKKVREELVDELMEFEQRSFELVEGVMTVKNKKAFRKSVGERMQHSVPNFSMFSISNEKTTKRRTGRNRKQ
ncbi:hypothetical protein [Mariniblastus fucicola]|uniref:hypothetical protein n=1 Tax=Mariniblastus fucicola TaxID=980251 RepID=UPI001EE3CDCD|nr:hypothetical protein [Mariniblastus fucicola]